VALDAVLAELAAMLVIPAVAGHTVLWRASVDATGVTLDARDIGVRAGELEGGLGVVKYGARPAIRGVALGAVLAELAAMLVIRGMAGHTALWRAGVDAAGMALDAGDIGMRTGELEGGLGVVKDGARPAIRGVALGAVLAELAPVWVVPAVASHAFLWRAVIVA
jgi:hypothetical protein